MRLIDLCMRRAPAEAGAEPDAADGGGRGGRAPVEVAWPAVSGPVAEIGDDGGPAALEAAFDAAAGGLYRFVCVRVGGDGHLTDDLMQQLWLEASGSESRPRDVAELEPWLFGIARNLVRNHWRRVGSRPAHLPLPDPEVARELAEKLTTGPLTEEDQDRGDLMHQLALAITELPAGQQALFVGHYCEGKTFEQLAEQADTSVRSVEGRLYRIRRRLRERLIDDESWRA